MRWSSETKRVIDEIALSSIGDVLQRTAARIERHPDYAGELRFATLELLNELWPPAEDTGVEDYFSVVGEDIDKIPADLLDDLSGSLTRVANRIQPDDRVASAASSLIAGCLMARSIELQGAASLRRPAGRLKQDHTRLIGRLLQECRALA
ncbi:MAG: hypothetical protein ACR2PM_14115 [Hyphomicrobiales bacterium]